MDDDRNFLFVITHGRSGSTLLQGVLNSIPGYSICGENMDACQHLYSFYKSWKNSIDSFHNNSMPVDGRNSWYQVADFNLLKLSCRNLVWNLCACHDTMVTGFKEIRWRSHLDKDFYRYLFWFNEVFCPRFIFLTRDLDETCQSAWFKGNPKCKNILQDFNRQVSDFFITHSYINCFHLDLGKLHGGVAPDKFVDLFDWLGEEYVESDVQKVLDVRWGY